MRRLCIALLLSVLSSFLGCGGSGGITAVRGTVMARSAERQVLAPLAGATVTCAGITATTAADGAFEFVGLPLGQFTITATAAGYHAYAGTVAVTHARTTTHDIQLDPVASGSPTGTVSGTVTQRIAGRQTLTPLAGVTVACGGVSAVSAADGSYLLSGVPAGQLTLTASLTGYGAYAGLVLAEVNRTVLHDIQMSPVSTSSPAGTVHGLVTRRLPGRQALTPLVGVTVACGGVSATTSADGAYRLTGVAPGQLTITANLAGYGAYAGLVTVVANQTAVHDIQLSVVDANAPTGTVRGSVVERVSGRQTLMPLSGVTVACGGVSAASAADGTFQLSGVPAGQLTITAALGGYTAYAGLVTVVANQTALHDIQMTAVPPVGPVTGTLAVTVHSAGDGLALTGVAVSCGGVTAHTAADGTCTLSGVPVGQQTLTASASGYESYGGTVDVVTGTTPVPVTLVASGGVRVAVSPTTLQVTPGQRYAFHATVTGTLNGAVTWSVREGGVIAADGTLTAPATPGTYHVDAVSVADISQSATATVTVVAVNQMIPFTGTRSYDVGGMTGGPLDGTGLRLTVTNQPPAGRRGRDASGLQVVIDSDNGVFDQALMTIQDVLQSYLAGTLTTDSGVTCSVEIRFLNGGDSLVIIIRFEGGPSTGNALKMLAVTATAAAPQGFAVRRTVHLGGAALALVQGARVVLYEWDFDGDGTYDHGSDTTPEVDHVYTAAGSFPATLRVTDSGGGVASDTLNLTIVSGSTVVVVQ